MSRRVLVASSLALLLLLSGACGEEPKQAVGPPQAAQVSTAPPALGRIQDRPSVVLVTVDTLRRDHLGCYGYTRETSPRIDRFAASSTLFERAVATMATTLPSHLSMLTGLYPHQHGVSSNQDAAEHPYRPREGARSLAQALGDAGYATAAFVSGTPVQRWTGIDAGFGRFDGPSESSRPGRETNARALEWLDQASRGPFFLWVHYFDPHEPNEPAEPYASMFEGGAAFEPGSGHEQLLAERRLRPERIPAEFATPKAAKRLFPGLFEVIQARYDRGEPLFDHAAIADLIDRYDGDVRCVDDLFGELLDKLDEIGRSEGTIVVFTADHGQSLGDHDWIGHGRITNENVLVPLIVRFPAALGSVPARVSPVISLIDLAPTLVARIDHPSLAAFAQQCEGRDVFSGSFSREFALAQRTSRELGATESGTQHALLSDRWRYVFLEGGPEELYDLASDPAGHENVIELHPEVAARMRAQALEVLERARFEQKQEGSRAKTEILEQLGELGYVDGD